MTKYDEFDMTMNFRYNLSMYLLVVYMLGGTVQE